MKKILPFLTLVVLFAFSNIAGNAQCGSVCSGLTTYTQGGWGSAPHGDNPGTILSNNFAAVYPSGVTIGCNGGYTFRFTSASAIDNFLPQGGTPGSIHSSATNPTGSYSVLAGQILAATINIDFDRYNPSGYKTNNAASLANLTFKEGTFNGKTVQFVLDEANKVLGGLSSSYSASDLNDALTTVNENYDGGSGNNEGELENEASVPTVASITGTATVCKGSTTTLSDATAGGVWSTGDATIATVSSGGIVTGVAAGTVTITYSVTNSCGIGSKSLSVTVNALPAAPTVSVTQPTCAVATGTITVTAPTGSGYTYSTDGTNY
ncbi:MAG: hypothetical protein KGL19_02060, partial [Bacteroidota bacterium]|nr:hypothetical protein [Bacteroidota bacterium]